MDHNTAAFAEFEAALVAAIQAAGPDAIPRPPGSPDPVPLAAAMEEVRIALPLADNLGRSGDERDLYALADKLTSGVKEAYPESLCKAGCSGCCRYPEALFTATAREWDVILDHIEREWPAERVFTFVSRFWETHGRYWRRLKAAEWLIEFPLPLPVHPRRAAIPIACPFLEDHRCAIYPVRPLYCRSFGSFTYKSFFRPEPAIYGCEDQAANLEPLMDRPGRPRIPRFNPLLARRHALSKGGQRHLLAIWIARRWPKKWLAAALPGSSATPGAGAPGPAIEPGAASPGPG